MNTFKDSHKTEFLGRDWEGNGMQPRGGYGGRLLTSASSVAIQNSYVLTLSPLDKVRQHVAQPTLFEY